MKTYVQDQLQTLKVAELRALVKAEMAQIDKGARPKGVWKLKKAELINFLINVSVTRVSMAEAVAYRSETAASDKIPPMMTSIVKQGQFVPGIQTEGWVRVANLEDEDDVAAVNCIIVVNGLTPGSPYYNKFVTNSGQTVRNAHAVMRVVGVLKLETSSGAIGYSQVDRLMHVNDVSMAVELGGENTHPDLYVVDEGIFFKKTAGVFEKEDLRHYEVFTGSNSQKRGGDTTYVDARVGVGPYAERMGFRPEAHYGHDGAHTTFDANKAGNRLQLPASASKDIPVFEGFTFEKTEEITLTSEIVDPDGTKRPDKVARITTFRRKLAGGRFERRIIGHFPEFEVELFVNMFAPKFQKNGKIGVKVLEMQRMVRDAMDGAFLFDANLAKKLNLHKAGYQGRALYVDKGFGTVYPELRQELGVDIAFFAGCTKGDPTVHMQDSLLSFSILNEAREVKEHESLKLSRQVLNAILNAPMAKGLVAETKAEIQRLLSFDTDALKQYINYQGYEAPEETTDLDGEQVSLITDADVQNEVDNLTLYLIEADKELALGSAAVNNKLLSLVKSTLKAIQRGQSLIVKDASLRHMVVDPYSVVQFLKQGKYGVCADKHPNAGILKDHALMVELKDGKLAACAEEALLFRFPFLHEWEAQRVNAKQDEAWAAPETMKFYKKWAKLGYFQGLICYSLWDMHPEAQSGADFDGDQTVVCKNRHILDNFKEADAFFLDYSLVETEDSVELVAGCPFEERFAVDLKDFVPDSLLPFIEKYDIHFADKKGNRNQGTIIRFPSSLEGNATLQSVLVHAMSRLNLSMLKKNDIGRFTNLQATVKSLEQECEAAALQLNRLAAYLIKEEGQALDSPEVLALQADHAKLKAEASGHRRLVFLLAIAIRWEIDAAKHGGAYRQQMPFLAAFKKYKVSERAVRQQLQELERRFGISLQTLIIGNAE